MSVSRAVAGHLGFFSKGKQSYTPKKRYYFLAKRKITTKCLTVLATQQKEYIKNVYAEEIQQSRVKQLNQRLLKCLEPQDLLKILRQQQRELTAENVAATAITITRIISSKNKITLIEYETDFATFYKFLCKLITQHAHEMNSQAVANCLWSLGKAVQILGYRIKSQYKLDRVFEILCDHALSIGNKLNLQECSIILFGMARFKWEYKVSIFLILKQAVTVSQMGECYPQAVANILWSMVYLKYFDVNIVEHFVQLTKKCLYQLKGQELSNIIWALYKFRYFDKELLMLTEDRIIDSDIKFNNLDIANLTFAFADFGLKNRKGVIQRFMFDIDISRLTAHTWSNIVYTLAYLDCPLNLCQELVYEYLENYDGNYSQIKDIGLRQIQQAKVIYGIKNQDLIFPSVLEKKCKYKLQEYVREKTLLQNSFLQTIYEFLRSRFDGVSRRVLIYEDQIEINLTLVQKVGKIQNKIAVMTNTPQVFFVNEPERLIGRRQYQISVVCKKFGWKVVNVNSRLWNNLDYQQQIVEEIQNCMQPNRNRGTII